MVRLTAAEHAGAAAVTVLLCVLLCAGARRWPGRWTQVAAQATAIVLVVNLAFWEVLTAFSGRWTPTNGLLLDVCPVTAMVAAAALWTRRQVLVELTYFWACGATVMGIVSPDGYYHFPDPLYFQFYVTHSGTVVAALFLVVGLRHQPRHDAFARAFAATIALVGVAAIADLTTGADYIFLRNKRTAGSLGDLLGPWPWYLLIGFALWALAAWALAQPFHGQPSAQPSAAVKSNRGPWFRAASVWPLSAEAATAVVPVGLSAEAVSRLESPRVAAPQEGGAQAGSRPSHPASRS